HLLTGGLIIGAVFMITDMVTSPMTGTGQLIFGFGCGAITLLIRMKGGYPEGVCYSILIMNAIVPLIDKFTVPTKFGVVAPKEVKA
ncbi:MAG: RnfABCDGE type electron transport complex subunit D, partial [Candidatus Riflebacteria bacterium]